MTKPLLNIQYKKKKKLEVGKVVGDLTIGTRETVFKVQWQNDFPHPQLQLYQLKGWVRGTLKAGGKVRCNLDTQVDFRPLQIHR